MPAQWHYLVYSLGFVVLCDVPYTSKELKLMQIGYFTKVCYALYVYTNRGFKFHLQFIILFLFVG